MPKKGNHWEQTVEKAYAELPAAAKAVMAELAPQLGADGREQLDELAVAMRRFKQRVASDTITDRNRRTLVGAHVPRYIAEEYKELAAEKGISLHKWVYHALEMAKFCQLLEVDVTALFAPSVRPIVKK